MSGKDEENNGREKIINYERNVKEIGKRSRMRIRNVQIFTKREISLTRKEVE